MHSRHRRLMGLLAVIAVLGLTAVWAIAGRPGWQAPTIEGRETTVLPVAPDRGKVTRAAAEAIANARAGKPAADIRSRDGRAQVTKLSKRTLRVCVSTRDCVLADIPTGQLRQAGRGRP